MNVYKSLALASLLIWTIYSGQFLRFVNLITSFDILTGSRIDGNDLERSWVGDEKENKREVSVVPHVFGIRNGYLRKPGL